MALTPETPEHDSKAIWLVGHDGSANAQRATEWAVTQAADRNVRLDVMRSWQVPAVDFPMPVTEARQFAPDGIGDSFDDLAVRAGNVGVDVTSRVVQGSATNVLLDASEDAELLVLGSRGLGGFRRLLLGSISSQCATHAVVPTVVVPSTASVGAEVKRVIVGLDGSERALQALRWATDFAPHGCEIRVVGTWMPSRSGYVAVAQHYTDERQEASDHFDELLDEHEAGREAQRFTRRFAFADAATTLLEEAEDAGLLVVGQRGHSGLSAAILGSVTTHVLHHSPVPVAVVPDHGCQRSDR